MLALLKRGVVLTCLFTLHAAVASSYHQSCQRTLWHSTMYAHSPFCELHRRGLTWMEVGATALAVEVTTRHLPALVRALDAACRSDTAESERANRCTDGSKIPRAACSRPPEAT